MKDNKVNDNKQSKPKFFNRRRIVLLAVNVVAFFIFMFCVAMWFRRVLIEYVLICQILFIICSLIVYYLSVIADAIGKIAANGEKGIDE